ncbi:AidA/PixA family protein [Photobacterium sp. J15]|uniref:AidA/PixA family protein n=1 Tax=Photobacterium sp. J15 TaxID=265901 RepID=UPI0007E4D536|nr:AidA/PixA family protein [Photobacterium sp. J15]
MAVRNVFASIDVSGFINDYRAQLINYYDGVDVTSKYMSEELEAVLIRIKKGELAPKKFGYYDTSVLPNYTRLVSSKDSTIGYKVYREDYEWIDKDAGELQLNNIYNLMLSAENGDKIIWWGHSIKPNSHIQAVISSVDKPGSSTMPPNEFRNLERKNVQFYYASGAVDPTKLVAGVEVSTQQAYCLQCCLEGTPGTTVSYDIALMLLSTSFNYEGSLISVPIAELVVDPIIKIQ